MSQTDTSVMEEIKLSAPTVWTVVFHNDDYTPMEFVTVILMEIFGLSQEMAEAVMLTIHVEGKAQVGQFTKEIALTKAQQVVNMAEQFEHPLLATAEEK